MPSPPPSWWLLPTGGPSTASRISGARAWAGRRRAAPRPAAPPPLLAKGRAGPLLDFSAPAGLSRLLGGPYLHVGLFARQETIRDRGGDVGRLVRAVGDNLRF